jgi:hypothetical protein
MRDILHMRQWTLCGRWRRVLAAYCRYL